MSCECYQIGGPWIAEDPNCPAHGRGGLQDELEEAEAVIEQLREEISALRAAAACHDKHLMETYCRRCGACEDE